MKKLSLTFLASLFLINALPAYALNLGLHAGPNFSTATIDDSATSVQGIDTKTGLAAGAFLNFPLGPIFSLQPEVNYVQRGFEYKTSGTDFTSTFNLNYIEVPVLLKLDLLGHESPIRPSVFAGPMLSILTSKSITLKSSTSTLELSGEDIDIYNDEVLSAVVGGNLDLSISDLTSFGIDLRYCLGLTNVIDQSKGGNTGVVMKNNGFMLLAAVTFKLL